MAKKLQPDYIQWVLKLNGSQTQKEIKRLEQSTADLKKENSGLQSQMAKLQAEGKKNTDEYKRLEKQLKQNTATIKLNDLAIRTCTQHMDKSQMTANQLSKEMRRLQQELRNTSKATDPEAYKRLQHELSQTEKAYRDATTTSRSFWQMLKENSSDILKGGLMKIGADIVGSIRSSFSGAIQTITEFQHANSQLAAVMGTTKRDIIDMTDQARELGRTTSFSASQVTELQTSLARLGFQREQIKAMTPEVLKFALAVGTDLGSAADLSGAALRMFGLEANETGRVVSAMAIGTTKSALSFDYLSSSLASIGPVASAFGFSIEDTIALLGALSNAGFDASTAATSTRNILLTMADPAGKLAKALGGPVTSLDELVAGMKNLEAQNINLAQALDITDKRSVAAFQTFLKGADSITQLREDVTDCHGSFDDMAKEMGDDLRGSMLSLQSALEGLMLAFSGLTGPLRWVVDLLTSMVGWVTEIVNGTSAWSTILRPLVSVLTTVGGALAAVAAVIAAKTIALKLNIIQTLAQTRATIAATAAEVKHKIALLAATAGCSKMTAAVRVLWATLRAHPLAAIVSLIGAVAGALSIFGSKTEEAASAQYELAKAEASAAAKFIEHEHAVKNLVKAINDENTSETDRVKLLSKLKELMPDVNLQLSKQGQLTRESQQAIDDYLVSLRQQIKMEALRSRLQDLYQQQQELDFKKDQAFDTWRKNQNSFGAAALKDVFQQAYAEARNVQKIIDGVEKQLDAMELKRIKSAPDAPTPTPTDTLSGLNTPKKTHEKKTPDPEKEKEKADKAALKREEENYQRRVRAQQAFLEEQRLAMQRAVNTNMITQEQADMYMLGIERNYQSEMINITNDYEKSLSNLQLNSNERRQDAQQKAHLLSLEAQREYLKKSGELSSRIRELIEQNPIGTEGMKQQYDRQVAETEAMYDALIDVAREAGMDTTQLEEQKQQKLLQMAYDYKERQWELQEQLGVTWQQQFDHELSAYQHMLDQKMITQKQFERKKLQLQVDNVKKYFDYYSGLSSSMFSAIQQAEIDQSEAKYDALIRQAENNGEDTSKLEEQKENEKLEIQKRYADVNFAIKVSQIVADTAVAIMKAYADLGPIAGSVAAALMTATGAAQVISAKAERDRIKNLQPKKSSTASSGSSSGKTATRTVVGYADGGYTGRGGRYDIAGIVHRGEYVVPQPIMSDPRVIDSVALIEAIRHRALPGYANGGPVSTTVPASAAVPDGFPSVQSASLTQSLTDAARDIHDAADSIRRIKAYVVYQDLEHAGETLDSARDYFTKNK